MFRLVCSECDSGNYRHIRGGVFGCECGKRVTHQDITPNLDPGEYLAKDLGGFLAVATD